MRYRLLGNSGLRVSELCLGAMTFGSDEAWCADARESQRMFEAFVEAGGNFIDTADIYTGGESERLVGEFVRADRERFVIASKYTNALPGREDPNAAGNHRKNLAQSLDASLKRTGLEYIDLYWVHLWEYTTPVEEVMRALDDAVRAGKVLYVGLSDVPAWVAARANTIAWFRGWSPVVALQMEYSLVERSIEREHIPLARDQDMTVMPWSPLGSGILSGKYTRGTSLKEPNRLENVPFAQLNERSRRIAEAVDGVADELEASSAQVALAWLRRKNTLPILGARTLNQLKDNLGCLEVVLSDEQVQRLDAISEPEWGHPYDLLRRDLPRALAFGGMIDAIDNHHSPLQD